VEFYPVHGGCYCVDFMQSEGINVMPSKRRDSTLSMGRIQIEDKVLDSSGRMVTKNDLFLALVSTLSSWIKQQYKKGEGGVYVGPDADSLARSGIELGGYSF